MKDVTEPDLWAVTVPQWYNQLVACNVCEAVFASIGDARVHLVDEHLILREPVVRAALVDLVEFE